LLKVFNPKRPVQNQPFLLKAWQQRARAVLSRILCLNP
jgi:hypothetical protein